MNHADQLRADALRWVLSIADTHHLPVPGRIETYEASAGWRLALHLDDEYGDDVRRWAAALDLPMSADLPVTGLRRRWTCVSASGAAPEIVFAGWDWMQIDSYGDFADVVTAETPMVAAV